MCESRGGRPGLPVPYKPYGFCVDVKQHERKKDKPKPAFYRPITLDGHNWLLSATSERHHGHPNAGSTSVPSPALPSSGSSLVTCQHNREEEGGGGEVRKEREREMGSDESHFNVSVGSDGQSHKTFGQTTLLPAVLSHTPS